MDLLDLAANPLAWAILGALLAIGELLAPGVYLIWLAGAATFNAGWALLGIADGPTLFGLFAGECVASLLIARRWMRRPGPSMDDELNQRGARLIGARAVVDEALAGGQGRVRVGDSSWTAEGPDLPAGAVVRIIAVSGNRLTVEAVMPLPSPPASPASG